MPRLCHAVLCVALAALSFFFAPAPALAKPIVFAPGASTASVNDRVRGFDVRTYRVAAVRGQRLTVDLKSLNVGLYFNIFPPGRVPGSGRPMFNAALADMPYTGVLEQTGTYTIEVYLMRNAARRNEWASYQLELVLTPASGRALTRSRPPSRPVTRATTPARVATPSRAPRSVAPVSVARPEPRPYLLSSAMLPASLVQRTSAPAVLGVWVSPPPPRPSRMFAASRAYTLASQDLALPCKPGLGQITQTCAFNLSQAAGSTVLRVVLPDGRLRAFRLSDEGNASTVGEIAQPLEVVREDGLLTVIPAPGERIEIPQAILRRR